MDRTKAIETFEEKIEVLKELDALIDKQEERIFELKFSTPMYYRLFDKSGELAHEIEIKELAKERLQQRFDRILNNLTK